MWMTVLVKALITMLTWLSYVHLRETRQLFPIREEGHQRLTMPRKERWLSFFVAFLITNFAFLLLEIAFTIKHGL